MGLLKPFFLSALKHRDRFKKDDPLIIQILHLLSLALAVLIILTGFVMLFLHLEIKV